MRTWLTIAIACLLFVGDLSAQVKLLSRRPSAEVSSWVPTSIPGCTIWLAADQAQLSGYTDGQRITRWYDNSGNGTDFTNPVFSGTVTNPSMLLSVKNGKPGILFDGSVNTQYLQRASSSITNMMNTNDGYWFIVMSNAPESQLFAWYLTANNRFKVKKLSGTLWVYAGANTSVTFQNPTDFTIYSGWVSNQLSMGFYSNNVFLGSAAHTATRSNASAGLYIGWDGYDSRAFGCVLEWVTYNRCLTPNEATEVRSNLNVKYALW